jgi:uncharacterized protein YcsI (UPF0317 family)
MVTISLPARLAGDRVLAGIRFTGGTATVERLASSTRRYFEVVGATIADGDAAAPAQVDLQTLNVPDLRDIAETEGIDVPARARKADIIGALESARAVDEE